MLERGLVHDARKISRVQAHVAEKPGICERVLRYKLRKYRVKDQ